MFNLAVGYIELCRSNFTLRADITPQIIEDNLADVILDRKKINTQFLYYMIWVDIEPHEYIYAEVFFLITSYNILGCSPNIDQLPHQRNKSTAWIYLQLKILHVLGIENIFLMRKWLFHGGRLHILMEQIQYIHLLVFSLNTNDKSNIS